MITNGSNGYDYRAYGESAPGSRGNDHNGSSSLITALMVKARPSSRGNDR